MKAIFSQAIFKENTTIHEAIKNFGIDTTFDNIMPDEPCLVMTSIQHANKIIKEKKNNVGMWYYPQQFEVSTWMAYYKKYMLNQEGYFLPLGCIDPDDTKFIKSNSGSKLVTGQIASKENLDFLKSKEYPETLMFVSDRKELPSDEWRFWLANGKVIGYTPYSWDENQIFENVPPDIIELANTIAKEKWQPDLTFVADFVMYSGKPKLIEINSTSTSGVYNMDMNLLLPSLLEVIDLELSGEISYGESWYEENSLP